MKWEKKTLDELGTVARGRSKHRPRNDPKLFGGKYPFIQTADVKNANFYISNFTNTYNEEGLVQSKLWPAGTLCITIAANIADTGILAMPACFPDSIMGFVADEEVSDTRFIKYCFDVLQKECKQISQGTAQDNLSWEKLSTIKFLIPPLPVQQRIASILSAYDDLIENNQKQIKLLEEAAQRLYKEWFVDLRFPGHEGVKVVDGVPEGWRKEKLVELAELKAGGDKPKNFSKVKSNICKVPIFSNGLENEGLFGYTDKADIGKESITISARGNVGYTCLRRAPYLAIVRLICVIPRKMDISTYLYFYLKHTNYNSNGSAQQQLTIPMIKNTVVCVPDENTLSNFDDKARCYFDLVDALKNQISSLREARDRLLPKLMSGEIEVEDTPSHFANAQCQPPFRGHEISLF